MVMGTSEVTAVLIQTAGAWLCCCTHSSGKDGNSLEKLVLHNDTKTLNNTENKLKKKNVEEQTQWDKVLACTVGSFGAVPLHTGSGSVPISGSVPRTSAQAGDCARR